MNYDQLVQEIATMKHMVITECTMCQIYILSAFLQAVLKEQKTGHNDNSYNSIYGSQN